MSSGIDIISVAKKKLVIVKVFNKTTDFMEGAIYA